MSDAEQPRSTGGGRRRVMRWLVRGVVAIVVVAICVFTFRLGLDIRQRVYENTTRIRHGYDIQHNLLWGLRAIDEGWLDLYGNVINENWPARDYRLDYVPLRLLVMRQWAAAARAQHPDDAALQSPVKERRQARWRGDYAFTHPLLVFNASFEALGAVAAFLLVRMWVRRSDRTLSIPAWRGCVSGAIAAAMYWFSPASQLSGQAWPSSDVWVPPFFLWAVLFACWNRWLIAGLVIGVGIMFKGQLMLVAPLFLLWPLFMGRPMAATRWLAGFLFAAGLIVAPWLLRDEVSRVYQTKSIAWVICVAIACLLSSLRQLLLRQTASSPSPLEGEGRVGGTNGELHPINAETPPPTPPSRGGEAEAAGVWLGNRRTWIALAMLAVISALLIWPWLDQPWETLRYALPAVALAVVMTWLTPLRWHGHLAAGLIGAGILALPFFADADLTWFKIGFKYGAEKFPGVSQFPSNTLAALLQERFRWSSWDETVITVHDAAVSLKTTMTSAYAIFLVLAAVGMAWHMRRGDRRFLVALTLPWMAAYAFMPQLHGRYLLFPATVGVVMVGVSAGLGMLNVVLIFLAWLAVMYLLLDAQIFRPGLLNDYVGPAWDEFARDLVHYSLPDSAWAVVMITFVLLHQTFARRRDARALPIRAGL